MSEVIKNKYLDLEGLKKYDELIKAFIESGDETLALSIKDLGDKIGSLDFGDSDATITSIITDLREEIDGIIGDVESLEDGEVVKTLVEISNKLKELDSSVGKNTQDISGVDTRLTALEGAVEDLGKIEGGENLATIVTKVNTNVGEIEILKGEGEGSVKKTAADAAATALEDAKEYADGLVNDAEGNVKFDAVGSAAQALADAKADAAGLYQVKGDYESAGAAAQALTDAKAYVDAIAHASEVKYEDGKIKLYDKEGKAIGEGFDASDFVVDGMLDSVSFKEVDGNKTSILVFTFNTDGGSKVIEVDFAKYVDVYHADEDTLTLDSTNNTFSIKEVKADITKLKGDITIAGGPLANNIAETGDEWPWTDDAGNKIIPQGKSMEEILTGLFLKVIDGTVQWGTASWSPTIANPTVTLSSNGPVEVGSTVNISTLTAGAVDAKKRSVTCTCSQGHFLADAEGNPTGSHVTGNKTIEVTATIDGSASLSCTWNGTTCGASDDLVVVEGTNTVIANQSGQTAKCEALPTTKVFGSTNTKSVLSNVSATFSENKPDDKPLTSSGSDSINAYYPIYTNGKQGTQGSASSESALVENDATKLALVADNTHFYVNFAPMIDGGTGYRLLVKSGKKITDAKALNTLNNNYEVDMLSQFVKASTGVKKSSGGTDIDYDVYEAKGSAGANALRFKID